MVPGASSLPSTAWCGIRQPRSVPGPSLPPRDPCGASTPQTGRGQEARPAPAAPAQTDVSGEAVPGRRAPPFLSRLGQGRSTFLSASSHQPPRPPDSSRSPPCPSLPQGLCTYLVLRMRFLQPVLCCLLVFLTYHLNFKSTFKKFTSTRNVFDAIGLFVCLFVLTLEKY